MLPESSTDVFAMLKQRFPHLNINAVNPEISFSENLHIIIGQMAMPQQFQTRQQISQMKQAVDSQQLKIQKSLINEENSVHALGQITNKSPIIYKKNKNDKPIAHQADIYDDSHWSHHQNSNPRDLMGDIMSEIWQFEEQPKHRDWFHH